MLGFRSEFGTHTQAALAGWKFPASFGDLMTALHYRAFLFANTEEKSRHKVEVPMPWLSDDERSGVADVSDEERAQIEAFMDEMSAIPE